ncbi:MAG: hypothetical protein U1A24_05855 [Cypionkella sp.]|uniref:hypothetical protein n=1 Tax=Cypionkella sp. TaxID=2811411 RepID=UPI002ABC9F71|nr:hypothetical protein [Cypionkella sp.]MDZ4310064.1 hypothetical protein [Cypionkella sp.]MDZ4393923.1 hypothetical protein [Cypionkella sp.]
MSLDDDFGPVRKATERYEWERECSPSSRCVLNDKVGQAMGDLLDAAASLPITGLARSANFIWGMDAGGEIWISAEEVAQINSLPVPKGFCARRGLPADVSLDKKLGHPCLMMDDSARIAGEIYIDTSTGEKETLAWTINARSGRFHREIARRPSVAQISNAAKKFAIAMGRSVYLDLIDDISQANSDVRLPQ